ncbi:MAG TPA: ABC transporter permease subunit [Ilumatobacteraceae bacterium]|nr:ABC transporter permease subunit [Ilumatobacteraceae bacterium]
MVDELNKSYVTVATSKGLGYRTVVTRHIMRNVGLVLVTMVGWEYARMWGGTVFLAEFTFAWPGIGKLVTDAASRHDFHVIQAGVVVAGVFVVLANLVVDLLATMVDRRVEAS